MTNRMREFLGAAVIATALAGLGLGLFACSPTDPELPEFQVGVVEGRVTLNGAGYPVQIDAQAEDAFSSRFHVQTDSTGRYRLELPAGLYIVRPELDGGYYSKNDTVRIAPQTVVIRDFPLGSALVALKLPTELEGRSAIAFLSGRQDRVSENDTVVDGSARFEFPVLRTSPYTLTISIPGCADYSDRGPDPEENALDSLYVVSGTPAFRELDFRSTYSSLSGLVTGSGLMDTGARIRVVTPDCFLLDSWTCEDDGTFEYGFLVPPEPFTLKAIQGAVSRWYGGTSCEDATFIDLQAGDRIQDIEIPTCAVRLHLQGPGERIFYEAITILRDEYGNDISVDYHGYSPLTIGNLAPGRYFVQVNGIFSRQPWAAQWYADAESLGAAIPVDLASGELGDLEFHLVPGGSVSGRVFFENGQELREVQCAIFDSQGQPMFGEENSPGWMNFPDGIFTISGLPDGEFYLAAKLANTSMTWYPGSRDLDGAELITIRDHSDVEGLTWNLIFTGKGER